MKQPLLLIGSGAYGQMIQESVDTSTIELTVLSGRTVTARALKDHPAKHVIIATPNFTHVALVKQALEAGKHVLCEKPLALSLKEVQELYALAKSKDLFLGVGFVLPHHPFYQWLKEQGTIKSMEVCNHATEGKLEPDWYWNERESGGWFLTAEIHWLHLYFWLTGDAPKKVFGSELKENGRTTQTWTSIVPATGPHVSVHHRLDMTYDTAWTKAEVFFANGTQAVIDDWVPQSLRISTCHPEPCRGIWPDFPSYIIQKDGVFYDTRSRDDRYASFIRSNISALLSHETQDQEPIILAHHAALKAQENANQKRDRSGL